MLMFPGVVSCAHNTFSSLRNTLGSSAYLSAYVSCIEISHVAKLINMDAAVVERKLSQMILDRTLSGILEQGKGHLVIYDSTPGDGTYTQVGKRDT